MPGLLDANGFIESHRHHYRRELCPGFWDWIKRDCACEELFSIWEVRREILAKQDDLAEWVSTELPEEFFIKPDGAVGAAMIQVSTWVSGNGYNQQSVARFLAGADPLLIAQALAHGQSVVTMEIPGGGSKRKVKIPDVCDALGVPWLSPFNHMVERGVKFGLL